MRQKRDSVLCFEWPKTSAPFELKIVRMHREKYKKISAILERNHAILDLADRDLKPLSTGGRKGRQAVYTSENLLRAMIVHAVEGEDLRSTVVRISDSPFLRDFLRLGNRRGILSSESHARGLRRACAGAPGAQPTPWISSLTAKSRMATAKHLLNVRGGLQHRVASAGSPPPPSCCRETDSGCVRQSAFLCPRA